jgi:hypothetical protein
MERSGCGVRGCLAKKGSRKGAIRREEKQKAKGAKKT